MGDGDISGHSHRWLLGVILLLALALRLAWGQTRPVDQTSLALLPDQIEYLATARSLLEGGRLGFFDQRFGQHVYAFRTPGYPAFLAACGANVRVARGAQAVLDTLTVLAAYLLARAWLAPGRGLVAAALVAFNPYLIYFSGLLLTETLFAGMLAWGMVLLTRPRTRGERSPLASWLWLSGVFTLALAVLVRPGAIGMPVLLALFSPFANRSPRSTYHAHPPEVGVARRWRVPVGAASLLVTLLVLLPWSYRNYRVLGQWVWTSTNEGFTAYDGFNPDADGSSNQSVLQTLLPRLRKMSEADRSRYLNEKARQFMRENPRRVVQLAALKVARTWSPIPLSRDFGRPLYVAAALLFTVPFFALVVIGLLRGDSLPRAAKVFLLLPAIYLTAVHALSVGSLRYRIPAEVPMAALGAAAFAARPAFSWKRADV